jgi:RNA polymerase sigma-70 factor, ECF subfamily
MTPSTKSDIELVREVQAGNKRAYDFLVAKYQYKVIALVNRFVHDEFEAQDVAQEAFIKAYRALKNFRGDSAFYTWLYRIAVNTAKNFIASRGRRPPAEDIDSNDVEQIGIDSGLRDKTSPEAIALSQEVQQAVFTAIEELPEELSTAIQLRELEGLSYEEIAEHMGCPIGTVRSRIFRAREAIDAQLEAVLSAR